VSGAYRRPAESATAVTGDLVDPTLPGYVGRRCCGCRRFWPRRYVVQVVDADGRDRFVCGACAGAHGVPTECVTWNVLTLPESLAALPP